MCVGGGKAQMQNKNRYSDLFHQPVYKTEQQVRCVYNKLELKMSLCALKLCHALFFQPDFILSVSYDTNGVTQYWCLCHISVEVRKRTERVQ